MKWIVRCAVLVGGVVLALRLLGYDLTIGGLVFTAEGVERLRDRGYRKPRVVVGGCVVSSNVDVDLMTSVVPRLVVCGGFVGPKALADKYGTGLKVIGGATLRDSPSSSSEQSAT